MMSLAIIAAACRPRNRKGEILYDALSLIDQHGKERLYKGIRIPVGGTSYGDTWLFDHPLFKQIQEAVKAAEDGERISASAAEQAAIKAQAAAIKEVMAPDLAAAMDAGKAAIKLANAIPVAANKLSMCAPCESGNLGHWMKCCVDLGRENINGLMSGWSGSCPCRTVFGATNSRCRMLADSLRFRRNADFWRISEAWGEDQCRQHVACIDIDGSTWLHLAIEHCDSMRGDISIVEAILDWGVPLEAKNSTAALRWLVRSNSAILRLCACSSPEAPTVSRHARLAVTARLWISPNALATPRFSLSFKTDRPRRLQCNLRTHPLLRSGRSFPRTVVTV